jgi:hypothetical protein
VARAESAWFAHKAKAGRSASVRSIFSIAEQKTGPKTGGVAWPSRGVGYWPMGEPVPTQI